MPTIKVNDVDLYYEVYGEGEPILGIHGTPSSAMLWIDAAQRLARHGRCVIYDRRGFFRSQPSYPLHAMDLYDHVGDAAALLDALGAAPAVVIGRSTGGLVALDLARRFPGAVRALVLLEPAVFTVDDEASAWAAMLRDAVLRAAADEPGSAAQVVLREALGYQAWESLPRELRDMFDEASPAVLAEIRGKGFDLSEEPLRCSDDELAGIRHPTLLVSAQDSPEALRRVNVRLAGVMANAESVQVPGGHMINPAHPLVVDFVARNLGPANWPPY